MITATLTASTDRYLMDSGARVIIHSSVTDGKSKPFFIVIGIETGLADSVSIYHVEDIQDSEDESRTKKVYNPAQLDIDYNNLLIKE